MISFNSLGNLGRLANQMFQYASLKGIAIHRGFDFVIPPQSKFGEVDPMVRNDPLSLYSAFDIGQKVNQGLYPHSMLYERMHTFDEELFNQCPDNVDLFGYFQTEKYFKHIEDDIKKDFSFSKELNDTCEDVINNLGGEDTISLHIRRTDYVHNPNHPVQPIEYYQSALDKLPKDIPVIVFSDDPEWCENNDAFEDDRFAISNNAPDLDLCLMTHCKYHIIANSSFSWWGAWLADSEKIIAPKNWFGATCTNKSVDDMSFGDWDWL
tara:strand:- start:1027 stop:1824 length:798 start_codon:yes stop_codon:yes gene_type:complete